MPTILPRIQVTQTPPVARALEIAEREWPGTPRAELIARLMARGAESVEVARAQRRAMRRASLEESRGAMADAYPPDYLGELREDWAE
jgi:hypothetical protein